MDSASTPIDLLAVRRDNELIEAIAGGRSWAADDPDEAALATLLSTWRADLISAELPPAPDMDEIVAAVEAELAVASTRRRMRKPGGFGLQAIGAAVAAGVVLIGVGWFSRSAEPGDPLWRVKQVVFSDEANSAVADNDSSSALEKAKVLVNAGKPAEAQKQLDIAAKRAAEVSDPVVRSRLMQTWESLTQQAAKHLSTIAPAAASLIPSPVNAPAPSAAPVSGANAPAPNVQVPKVEVSSPQVIEIPQIAPGIPTTIVIPPIPGLVLPHNN